MQEISPLPDVGSELAIAPAERLTPARVSAGRRKWTAAIVISCVLHAAVAAAFLISPSGTFVSSDAMQSEGRDQAGANVVGSALDRDPAAIDVALVPNPQPTKTLPEKPARPASPTEPSQPGQEATKHPPKPLLEPVKQPAATPDILVAGTPRPDNQSVAANTEMPPRPTAQSEDTEAPAAIPEQPPIPSARPSPAAAPATASAPYEKRGTADGHEINAAIASKGGKQKDAGNAAASRYSGEVAGRLARANRRVSKSAQTTARNNAIVAFVVLANGSISNLQLAKSSGSPELDQFALDLVRKQAPFPPIPPETGLSSWRFKAPIGPF
ncbi:TonB family protein [Mesorhizobium erdmanii]|uniref:TonB family protein n=2 Tax=Mesorhizobium erdmanii TaxID=1777866 RepID=A0A6M7UVF3_9HYPH|nr:MULTISPECIES: energy transducer TonB [Mesorhizobium]OBQ75465.1 energy transducer TonB [Mesorhizobium loti]QKC79913.1 TonB family protein [Mesorhizobium erdmanii]